MILACLPHSGHLITPGFQYQFQVGPQRVNLGLLLLDLFVCFVCKLDQRFSLPIFKVVLHSCARTRSRPQRLEE